MGPFAIVPFIECRHSVWSMRHLVTGNVCVNGQEYSFQNAWGYWEGDRGRSFPKEYIWTQCCFEGGALMLSVADIPMAGIRFNGIIGAILWQGNLELEVRLLEDSKQPLKAPAKGNMVRTIHESASCRAFYRFCKKECIFKHTLKI